MMLYSRLGLVLSAALTALTALTTTTSVFSWQPSHLLQKSEHLSSFARPTTTAFRTSVAAASKNQDNAVDKSSKTVVIAGATGYIGKSVVRESVRQGYKTVALVRDAKKVFAQDGGSELSPSWKEFFEGADIVECDVTNLESVTKTLQSLTDDNAKVEGIISCLASRSGVKKDAYLIDYQATLNCLQAGQAVNARHFVLLSAICVRNPILQFQKAKLDFEAALQAQSDLTWTIVRPTAFFKSVSGQLEVVQSGAPFVMFGDGEITRCNPIAESELAEYLVDSIADPKRCNQIINLGGPDEPLTMKKQGEMLFAATGKQPKFIYAPTWLFDAIINSLQFLADTFNSEKLQDAAETARIGKYYAVEDMLTTDPNEKYGKVTLQEHYNRIAVEGQEYDPFTTMFAGKKATEQTASAAVEDSSKEAVVAEK